MNRFLLILFCFCARSAGAAVKPDAGILLGRLNAAKTDSQKIAAYESLIRHYTVRNPDSAACYADRAFAYCKAHNYRVGEGMILAQLAVLDHSQGRINIATQRFLLALEIYKELKYNMGLADVLGNLGALKAAKGDIEGGTKYIITSLRINDSVGNYSGLMIGYMNIGSIYLQLGDTANATKYLGQAEAVSRKIPLTDKTIALYNMIGVLYATKNNAPKALEYFKNDLKLSDKPEFDGSHIESLLYLGDFYHEMHDYDKAMKYLQEGMKLAEEKDMPEMRANMLLDIAGMIKEQDPASAAGYLKEAEKISRGMDNKSFLISIYSDLANLSKQQGKYQEALSYTEQKQQVKDSLYNLNKAIEMTSIAATYELEKSNLRVKDLEVLSMKNAAQRNLVIGIAAGIAMLLIILGIFFRKTVALNRQLKAHEADLKDLNNMKDKFFSIIGHDLRSPIARIPVILDFLEDESTTAEEKQYLLNSMREHSIASMEMLDKLLFWGQSLVKGIMLQQRNIYMNEFVRENIALKKIAAQEKQIQVIDKIPDDLQVRADATHFDFIVRNLLSNAIKYTHTNGTIELSADTKSKPGFTVFSVKDNGVGINKELLPGIFSPIYSTTGTANEKGTGIGLMLCREFAQQNGGNMWVESEAGSGSTFYLSLKNAA